jgi:integrase/recombinase XerD
MREREPQVTCVSALAPYLLQFIAEKRTLGCRAGSHARLVVAFDRFLAAHEVISPDLARPLVDAWVQKRPHESPRTQASRASFVRQVGLFLVRRGFRPYLPDPRIGPRERPSFTPYIFTPEEIGRLLTAADALRPHPRSPHRECIFPLIFRLLYGCGLRIGEVLHLQIRDVDLDRSLLTIREAKFRKDRLVPVAPSLAERLRSYARACLRAAAPTAPFFPAPDGGPFCHRAVGDVFRTLLWQCRISYQGRGRGPRLHDLRHTSAVHRLMQWYREGQDLEVALPMLATYLGHVSLRGTQRYLHLTAQFYPDLQARLEACYGHLIPSQEPA